MKNRTTLVEQAAPILKRRGNPNNPLIRIQLRNKLIMLAKMVKTVTIHVFFIPFKKEVQIKNIIENGIVAQRMRVIDDTIWICLGS